jgi:rSAM/selenodomain-associated transferase 2
MLSVVIPALNAEASLGQTMAALVPAAVDGLVREVIVVDAHSVDRTAAIAESAGAIVLTSCEGRGQQLATGASRARFPWLLFLHADSVLEPGWEREAVKFMESVDKSGQPMAAAFRFALDDRGARPRILESLVACRCTLLRLPYGDQGLLLPRPLYDAIGGYSALPLMEDVDIVSRLGRRRLRLLNARAVTSAERYRREGYLRRSARNLLCLALYGLRVPTPVIRRLYGDGRAGASIRSA